MMLAIKNSPHDHVVSFVLSLVCTIINNLNIEASKSLG